jgi:glycerophosphoryl diester phosphodiesterase
LLIYGHRGASRHHLEHSLEAYNQAIIAGADGFECDVRLTLDREIVCWHDRGTKRITGKNLLIATSTFKQLEFANPLKFSTLLDLAITNKKNLAIETKHPVPTGKAIEVAVLDMLEERKADIEASGIDINIMSFSKAALLDIQNCPYLGVFLTPRAMGMFMPKAPVVAPRIKSVKNNPELIERMHEAGKKVYVWTVNEVEDIILCAQLGVDAIISDVPGLARLTLSTI